MKNLIKQTKQGFTIIEVMIVLAIAGLIMAIVFFAVPQLQRNARDNQRQSVANRVKAELDTYASNNQGTYSFAGINTAGDMTTAYQACNAASAAPAAQTCNDFAKRYLTNVNTNDPSSGNPTTINMAYDGAAAVPTNLTWGTGKLWVAVGAKCSGDQPVVVSGGTKSSKQYALFIALDRTNTYYCIDNGS